MPICERPVHACVFHNVWRRSSDTSYRCVAERLSIWRNRLRRPTTGEKKYRRREMPMVVRGAQKTTVRMWTTRLQVRLFIQDILHGDADLHAETDAQPVAKRLNLIG